MKNLLLTLGLAALPMLASAQAVNDECANAVTLAVNSDIMCTLANPVSFTDATLSSEATTCGSSNDIWYRFTATQISHKILPSLSSIYQQFTLYSGTCGSLTEMACGTTESGNLYGLTPNETYYLRIFANPIENISEICIVSPPTNIEIDNTYTAEELVEDILVNSQCIAVSNISATSTEGFTGLAYFNKAASYFPFEEGIVLSTGNTSTIIAEPYMSSSTNNGGTDEDLNEFAGGTLNDAAFLEFDFVPQVGYINFNFLFASNEYGIFQCSYADAFVFLLTDTETGETVNLAVIPGTTIPVSVTTIRDNSYNANCTSENEDYFGDFYGANPEGAPINMLGTTIPMTAEATVIPGHTYHLKMAIGDWGDQIMDAAVFIDAGSFNMGNPDSGEITLVTSNGNVLCNGEETTISIDLSGNYTFTWSKDGVVITDEDTNAITVDEAGIYTLSIISPDMPSCAVEYSITVLTGDLGIDQVEISDIVAFNNSGLYEFNLNVKTNEIYETTGNDDYNITYHVTQADAENAVNPLSSPFTNTDNPQTIYVRLEGTGTCYTISSFTVVVLDTNYTTPAPIAPPSFVFEEGDTLADIPVEGENIEWYDNPGEPTGPPNGMDGDTPLPMDTMLVDGTTYYAAQTVWGIESLDRTPVTVHSTLGTEDTVFNGLMTYPNPVSNMLTISNSNAIDTVTVYNLLGQAVAQTDPAATETSLDFSGLAGGVYMVKITSGNKEKTIRVVKE